MKSKLIFWLGVLGWVLVTVLMVLFTYEYLTANSALSYFWCGVVAFGCGVGTIFFPIITLTHLFFTFEEL